MTYPMGLVQTHKCWSTSRIDEVRFLVLQAYVVDVACDDFIRVSSDKFVGRRKLFGPKKVTFKYIKHDYPIDQLG